MKNIATVLFAFTLFVSTGNAQIFIEPVIGYQADLSNNNRFKLVNTAVQISFKKSRFYELLLQVQKTWGFSVGGSDSSFSLNPSLPLYASAPKKIRPSSYYISVGNRFSLVRLHEIHIFSMLVYTGINIQRFAVRYQYDKNNYTILNPDGTLTKNGAYISGGVEYMRLLRDGKLFIQAVVASPPARKNLRYPSSFGFMAPLSLNAGYSVLIKKDKHAKK